jgi:hypothetical protein
MKIAEQLEKIKEDMCDQYCRWPLMADIMAKNEDDIEDFLSEKCAACPLNKL